MFKQWEWFKEQKEDPQEVSCYSLVAGNVLCRYWGEGERSEEANIIEKAKINYKNIEEAKNIIRALLSVYRNKWQISDGFSDRISTFLES